MLISSEVKELFVSTLAPEQKVVFKAIMDDLIEQIESIRHDHELLKQKAKKKGLIL